MSCSVAITLDVDWAPDFIIKDIAQRLIDNRVKSTWFITHETPALQMLRKHPEIFELGIHPNFKDRSSHGCTMREVVDHCMVIVPEAVSARSHGLIQSDYLWRHYVEYSPIRHECSTFLGHMRDMHLSRFFWGTGSLWRIPHTYQDNIEMTMPSPVWKANIFLNGKQGIQIFDFHPFYVYTNSFSMKAFEAVKSIGRSFHELTEDELYPLKSFGNGAGEMFDSVLQWLSKSGGGFRMKDIPAACQIGASEI